MYFRIIVLWILFFFCSQRSIAQTYPSALVTTLNNPKTLFLDEYADPFHPKIKTSIFFTDFSETSWRFSLHLKITGPNGLIIQTKPGSKPLNPFIVTPGVAYEIQGADLAYFFNYDNLIFNGVTRNQLEVNNRLPEGLYTFSFEAIDYESGKALSHPSYASAYLSLNDPPFIISPAAASVVENISQQNILFQWQVGNATGNLNLSNLSYQIDLYEVNNDQSNPLTAILNHQALLIWQSPQVQQMSYLYSTSEPPLDKSKRYVYTVRAIESSGRCSFKNNGYSTPSYFQYGYSENDTIDIIKPEDAFQFTLGTATQFKWKKPRKALSNQLVTYTLKLVAIDSAQDAEDAILNNNAFYQQSYLPVVYPEIDKTIPVTFWANIKRMGKYAWQVYASSGTQQIAKSKVYTFTGPPEIENFIAGGFLMTVTKLTAFNKTTNVISGRCKTNLNSAWGGLQTEFKFENIGISSLGNNEWVMNAGNIADKINVPAYTLQPQSYADNHEAIFTPDSIFVSINALKLKGITSWDLPLASSSQQIEKLTTQKSLLNLANFSFYLSNSDPIPLQTSYQIELMEPYGFTLKINPSSDLSIYQSKYEFNFNGFVQMPVKVPNQAGNAANLHFHEVNQLNYIVQTNNQNSENFKLAKNTNFGILPTHYIIDLSEKLSPGEFNTDSTWKGLYIEQGNLEIPKLSENSGQITLPANKSFSFQNTVQDTNHAYVTHRGLFFKTGIPFAFNDSLKFNSFISKSAKFFANVDESEIQNAGIQGSIVIPLIDTLNAFPYLIELNDYGFNEGYLVNGLANTNFTFNPHGSADQKINVCVQRAVFKGRNRLEMDLNMQWPYFDINISGVQRFSVWGNSNIGFDVPNGKAALTYQAQGKSSNFDIMVDYLGCGRTGNVYAIGMSAKINMDEEISGENGAPTINAYSLSQNSLLTAMGFVTPTVNSSQSNFASTSNTTNSSYQSSTSGYTNALQTGVGDALQQMGIQHSDTIPINSLDPAGKEALLSESSVMQIKQCIDIVYRLKPFIATDLIRDKDWLVLDKFRSALESDLVLQAQYSNAKGLLNFMLNKVLESLITRIEQPIQNISDKAMGKVRTAINGKIVNPVQTKINTGLSTIFKRLESTLNGQVEEKYHKDIHDVLVTVSVSISNGINSSVANSFETNITSKLGNFVQIAVTGKIKQHIRTEVSSAGKKLIQDGANAQISLSSFLQNSGTLFQNMADTVKDVIMDLNAANFINTAESLVDDAINGIDWNAISTQILNQLLAKGISAAVSNLLSQTVSQNAGPYVAAALSMVKFDFNNLGEKIKNGQIDKIVKFDPTNIYIVSPAVDIRGSLNFTKDDPIYGDSWQADVLVRVKVPKKDNPIELSSFFLNGKTTQMPQNFTYWFVKLSASGFTIPLNPAPVVWYGVEGFAFSKMKRTTPSTVVPDKTNKFGVGCKFYFQDQASAGKTYLFDLGAEAEFNDGGFNIQLTGNVSVLNYSKVSGKYSGPGFVTGTGTLGYFKTSECSKIKGDFNVTLNTSPILCAGGDVGLDLKGPNDWKVWVGTQQNPIGIKILCKDFLSNTGFMEFGNTGFKSGLDMNVNISARSPWLEFNNIKVRGFANLNFGYHAFADISWDPAFAINEATISAWAIANIGIDYETAVNSNSVTIAGISLAGTLSYKSQPESELHGSMSGNITVLNYSLGFNTPVHYSLSQQQILN